MHVAINYSTLASISIIANISSQDVSLRLYDGSCSVLVSVLVGTAVGLIVKYILDKKYIFQFQTQNTLHDAQTFTLYTIMGMVTTAIFWGLEFSFDYFFQSKEMRYAGGIIGLTIGYYIKYKLDKRFVFVKQEA